MRDERDLRKGAPDLRVITPLTGESTHLPAVGSVTSAPFRRYAVTGGRPCLRFPVGKATRTASQSTVQIFRAFVDRVEPFSAP